MGGKDRADGVRGGAGEGGGGRDGGRGGEQLSEETAGGG